MKKLERESSFKDEEIRHYKGLASDLAGKMELADAREKEYEYLINLKKVKIVLNQKETKSVQKLVIW